MRACAAGHQHFISADPGCNSKFISEHTLAEARKGQSKLDEQAACTLLVRFRWRQIVLQDAANHLGEEQPERSSCASGLFGD